MFNKFYNKKILDKRDSISSTNNKSSQISREEIERRIFERFTELNVERNLHHYLISYDFHPSEENMIHFWEDVINFLLDSVYQSFSIKISTLLEVTKLKNRRPLGLQNIISELINRKEFILSSELETEEYFHSNYKNLYAKESWGSWVKKGLVNTIKLPYKFLSSSNTDKSLELKQSDLLINKKLFHEHLENILNILSKILIEEDVEVLTKHELSLILTNSGEIKFRDSYLDLCLNYLKKIKKIEIFKVRINNIEMDCIKLLRDEESSVTEKDKAIINILVQLKNFDRKIEDTMTTAEGCVQKAKELLKQKNREAALHMMRRKNVYIKAYHNYSNMKFALEQNLIDLKSMESNQNVKSILEDVAKSSEKLKMNIEEMDLVTEKLKEKQENIKEMQDILVGHNNENLYV
jgi:hypothetical protein